MDFHWLAGVDVFWGIVAIIGVYAAIAVWALAMPPAAVFDGAPDHARWRDLPIWVVPLMLANIALYWLFRG